MFFFLILGQSSYDCFDYNYNTAGDVTGGFSVASLADCQNGCLLDQTCTKFIYFQGPSYCFLKAVPTYRYEYGGKYYCLGCLNIGERCIEGVARFYYSLAKFENYFSSGAAPFKISYNFCKAEFFWSF